MSPEELTTHNLVKTEVLRVLANLNVGHARGILCSDRTLLTNEEADLSTEPDGTFLLWASLKSRRVRLVPREKRPDQFLEVIGSPDWVLEIVSESSEKKDTTDLPVKYHQAGIQEYWLIDARGDRISFRILIRGPKGCQAAARRGGWQKSKVFGKSFRLERKRHPSGLWVYTLRVKPA